MTETVTTLDSDLYGQWEPTITYPGDTCCTFYNGTGYQHEELSWCHEGVERDDVLIDVESDGISDWNNKMTSFYCGKNVWWNFYRDWEGKEEDKDHIMSGAGFIRNRNLDVNNWNNTVSRVKMGPYYPENIGAVNIYRSVECYGNSARLYWNPDDPEGGQYNLDDMKRMGYSDNTASSIQVPKGYQAYIYKDNGLNGDYLLIEGAYVDDSTQELQCFDLRDTGFHDKLTSILIKRTPHALGYWQSITSTESQEYTFHVGINYEQSESTTTEIQQSLTLGMELGIEYGWASASTSIEASYSESLTHDVQSTYGLDYSVDSFTTCTTTTDKEGAGLFQWIISTSDYSAQAYTWHTVCRTGDNWNVAPECPWSACLDPECLECATDWMVSSGRRLSAEEIDEQPVSGVQKLLNQQP